MMRREKLTSRFSSKSTLAVSAAACAAALGAASVYAQGVPRSIVVAEEISHRTGVGRSDWEVWSEDLRDNLPPEMGFTYDERGLGAMVVDTRARFATVSMPLNDPDEPGLYVSFGVGRDKDLKEASDRRFATKIVVGFRAPITEKGEFYAEARHMRGLDLDGLSGGENQFSIGLSFSF